MKKVSLLIIWLLFFSFLGESKAFAISETSKVVLDLSKLRNRFDPIVIDAEGLIRQSDEVIGSYSFTEKKNFLFTAVKKYRVYDLGGRQIAKVKCVGIKKTEVLALTDNRKEYFRKKHAEDTSFQHALSFLVRNGYF